LHKPEVTKRAPIAGDKLRLANRDFTVLAVGSVASDNLLNLGHLDLKANGLESAELPGDVNVEIGELPTVEIGDRLEVYSA
jgi:PTS system glucitol/sorbitol-specific IIA component